MICGKVTWSSVGLVRCMGVLRWQQIFPANAVMVCPLCVAAARAKIHIEKMRYRFSRAGSLRHRPVPIFSCLPGWERAGLTQDDTFADNPPAAIRGSVA